MKSSAWNAARAFALAIAMAPRPANGAAQALEPSRAQADIDAAMRDRGFTFCSGPREPLSRAARALCPGAADIPGCAGFAAACASSGNEQRWPLFDRLMRILASLMPQFVKRLVRGLARIPAVVFLLLVAAAVIGGLFAALRAARRLRTNAALREHSKGAMPPSDRPSTMAEMTDEVALLALAEKHSRAGHNEVALQLYLAASLRALDRRGAIRWARDRTNGEYLRSCAEESSRGPLREIVREVDRVQFGRAAATETLVAHAARLAAGIVRWIPIAVLIVALPVIAGCGALKGRSAGDDPAGDDLFRELLVRQRMRVEGLEQPLGSLPPPQGRSGPAVVVDVETTPLDDETGTHLVEWVRAGGVLVLVGAPEAWPRDFGATTAFSSSRSLSAWARVDGPVSPVAVRADLLLPTGFDVRDGGRADASDDEEAEDADDRPEAFEPAARLDDGATYAAAWPSGRGLVLGVAADELVTNAGLAHPRSSAALVAILSHANRSAFVLAQPEDGVSPPSSPLTSLRRAGLGLALGHSLVAAVVLFLAFGIRLARPRRDALARRRAFAEHVEAVGALYARAGAGRHALESYGRFVEQRLRARMPRGASDLATFLAARSQLSLEGSQRLLAQLAGASDPMSRKRAPADDLMVIKELSEAYAAAIAKDK